VAVSVAVAVLVIVVICQTFVVRSRNPIFSSVLSIYLWNELTCIDTNSHRPDVLYLMYSVLPAERHHLAI
jgi:hypothetical protein